MLATKITNHVEEALSQLLQQYKGRPRIEGLLSALVQQIQDLENATFDMNEARQLFNGTTYPSVGAQLDGIGQIVGAKRNGLNDAEYLVIILGTIAENNSDSTAPALLNIVVSVFQAISVFIKDPNSPGHPDSPAQISFGVGDPQTPTDLYPVVEQIIKNSIGAGISIVYISTFNNAHAFSTDGPQSWCRGCSDLNNPDPDNDGQIASLIFNNPVQ